MAQHNRLVAGALVLYWQIPFRLGTIAYIPRGPVIDWGNNELTEDLLAALDSAARQRRALFLKLEPDLEHEPDMCARLAGLGFKTSTHTIQTRSTILVDVGETDENILARMNQGTRRKIRTAARSGVTIRHGMMEDIDSFHRLLVITQQRDNIAIRDQEYYRKLLTLFTPQHSTLLLASYHDRDLGALIIVAWGNRAWYLHGASSDEDRNRMPNYALQWEAMRWARENGCAEYDLFGIPDEDVATLESLFRYRQDGAWGLYGFKRGFGGRVWRAIETWDRPYNRLLYIGYTITAAIRDWWRAKMDIKTVP